MSSVDLTPKEIAALYVRQVERWVASEAQPQGEINALSLWERLITEDPERAWPVFEEIVALRRDDAMLDQVACRIRILLSRHWDAFHERAAALVRETPRFARVAGDDILDPAAYAEKALDVDALIAAHERMHEHSERWTTVSELAKRDSERGLLLALEIIHRGPRYGFSSFDTFDLLRDSLRYQGRHVIDRVEPIARDSYLVRRAIWRMVPSQRGMPEPYKITDEIWQRALAARGDTTDWTDDTTPVPQAAQLSPEDEALVESWFAYENSFWAFEQMDDLVTGDPETAWPILLTMINRASDDMRIGTLAAGPLEDLLAKHGEAFIDRIAAEAKQNDRLRQALAGVWISSSPVYPRYLALMRELGLATEE